MKPTNTAVSPPGRLGRFEGLNTDEVKAFRNLVRSSDGLQYGISVVEAQMSLSWNVPSGKERRETAVFAGLGKCRVLHP